MTKTGAEIIRECGDDASKWADEFMEVTKKVGRMGRDTMVGWFANAIESRPRPRLELSGSEAVFGFVSWLTTRLTTTKMGSTVDCGALVDLIKQFCETNELSPPRDRYSDYLKHPVER